MQRTFPAEDLLDAAFGHHGPPQVRGVVRTDLHGDDLGATHRLADVA
jgi:hypothetical protein